MIEKLLYEYLSKKMSCSVYTEIPSTKPKTYVAFQLIDGGKRLSHKYATIDFICVAESLQKASELNEELKNAIKRFNNEGFRFC